MLGGSRVRVTGSSRRRVRVTGSSGRRVRVTGSSRWRRTSAVVKGKED